MTTASLTAAILQLALLILNGVSNNPNIPPATANQAIAIAEQASQFANQNTVYIQPVVQQQCYSYGYNGYCNSYASPVSYPAYNPYQNYNPYPNYNPYTPVSTYNPYSSGIQLMIFNSNGVDSGAIQSGALYNVVWSPYDSSQGPATVQLYSYVNGNPSFITSVQNNTIPWLVNAAPGSYQLRVLQNGSIIVSRNVTVQ